METYHLTEVFINSEYSMTTDHTDQAYHVQVIHVDALFFYGYLIHLHLKV